VVRARGLPIAIKYFLGRVAFMGCGSKRLQPKKKQRGRA
jgi:hypothetical protein